MPGREDKEDEEKAAAALLCAMLPMTLLPASALADDGDLVITFTGGGTPVPDTDYSCETDYELSSAKVYTIMKAGDYTISMKENKTKTADRIFVEPWPVGDVNLTLNNVSIERIGTAAQWVSGSLIGAKSSSNYTLTLTLTGTNSLTWENEIPYSYGNENQHVYAMRTTGANSTTTIQGDGSLTINAKVNTEKPGGAIGNASKLLLIKSGNITINSNYHGLQNFTNDDTRYEQTGGSVTINTGSSSIYGMQVSSFALSGGSLSLTGDNGMGLYVDSGITVSGGTLKISGYQGGGIVASKQKDKPAETGKIAFTGGVTDVRVPNGSPAVYSLYTDLDSSRPSTPAQPITLGANMRVTAGGSPVWTPWKDSNVASAFSTGQPKIGASSLENVSSHVHIEPVSGVPETGDSATPMLWLGLILLAGAGLAVSAVMRRRRQNG